MHTTMHGFRDQRRQAFPDSGLPRLLAPAQFVERSRAAPTTPTWSNRAPLWSKQLDGEAATPRNGPSTLSRPYVM
jgi:hypothetical protein